MVYIFQLAIGTFEENNKSVSINVFEPDDCLNDNKIILHRVIEALKIEMLSTKLIY